MKIHNTSLSRLTGWCLLVHPLCKITLASLSLSLSRSLSLSHLPCPPLGCESRVKFSLFLSLYPCFVSQSIAKRQHRCYIINCLLIWAGSCVLQLTWVYLLVVYACPGWMVRESERSRCGHREWSKEWTNQCLSLCLSLSLSLWLSPLTHSPHPSSLLPVRFCFCFILVILPREKRRLEWRKKQARVDNNVLIICDINGWANKEEE